MGHDRRPIHPIPLGHGHHGGAVPVRGDQLRHLVGCEPALNRELGDERIGGMQRGFSRLAEDRPEGWQVQKRRFNL